MTDGPDDVENQFSRVGERQSAHPMMVVAYAIIYVMLFILLVSFLHLYVVGNAPAGNGNPAQTAQSNIQSTQRKELVQAVSFTLAGGAAIIGIYFTFKTLQNTMRTSEHAMRTSERNMRLAYANLEETRKTVRQSQEEQSADRFTRAIDQIGNDKPETRLGGIYALEKIASENQEYRGQIVEVLSAYIRTNYHMSSMFSASGSSNMRHRGDLHAIFTILRRILKRSSQPQRELEDGFVGPLDLHRTDLRHADLREVDLQGADLAEVNLYDADLSHTNLKEANFELAHLGQGYLEGADVSNANFEKADLRYANLDGIQNYKEIASLYKANVYGIENPPEGFSEWARDEKEAVSISDDDDWRTARLS